MSPHGLRQGLIPHGPFDPAVAQNSESLGSNPGRVKCLSSRLYIYSAPHCSKTGVCSDAYDTVPYREPLKLFDKSRA